WHKAFRRFFPGYASPLRHTSLITNESGCGIRIPSRKLLIWNGFLFPAAEPGDAATATARGAPSRSAAAFRPAQFRSSMRSCCRSVAGPPNDPSRQTRDAEGTVAVSRQSRTAVLSIRHRRLRRPPAERRELSELDFEIDDARWPPAGDAQTRSARRQRPVGYGDWPLD